MANPQIFDENLKNEVKANLLQSIISSLEAKTMNIPKMRDSARYILDNIEKIKNYPQLLIFLNELNDKWPYFNNVVGIYKNRFYKEKENEVISKLSGFIKSQQI